MAYNSTRRARKRNNRSRKAAKNPYKDDPTIVLDRWHLDPIPHKAELTPEQEEFVRKLREKQEYERSAEGREAQWQAYLEKTRRVRGTT